MAKTSKIEWTERTWNPITGCTKVSQGCKNCYAETSHKRLTAMKTVGYEKPFSQVVCHLDKLKIPLQRKKPTTYFVNSMSDLFHPDVADDFIYKVFDVIAKTPHHTYQILTKRAERLEEFTNTVKFYLRYYKENPDNLNNLWLGVSVENQEQANIRIPHLLHTACMNKFLSCEPILGDLNLEKIIIKGRHIIYPRGGYFNSLGLIKWVIVGGESGKNARPMQKKWVKNIQNQCKENDVPFFFKQWGTFGEDGVKRDKYLNGCLIDGKKYQAQPMQMGLST